MRLTLPKRMALPHNILIILLSVGCLPAIQPVKSNLSVSDCVSSVNIDNCNSINSANWNDFAGCLVYRRISNLSNEQDPFCPSSATVSSTSESIAVMAEQRVPFTYDQDTSLLTFPPLSTPYENEYGCVSLYFFKNEQPIDAQTRIEQCDLFDSVCLSPTCQFSLDIGPLYPQEGTLSVSTSWEASLCTIAQSNYPECSLTTNFSPMEVDCVVSEEICDGYDNDCDGMIDEEDTDQSLCNDQESSNEISECVNGECTRTCREGFIFNDITMTCEMECVPVSEICDDLDNDCDGRVDETFNLREDPNHCGACNSTCSIDSLEGVCDAGTCKYICGSSQALRPISECITCMPSPEICDNVDNDCDQLIDESDAQPLCNNPDLINGSSSCISGTCVVQCDDGFEVDPQNLCICSGSIEICDEIDNNCNNETDEIFDFQNDSNHCGECNNRCQAGSIQGECVNGVCLYMCGTPVQARTIDQCLDCTPTDEVCDGIDNNCNGVSDEIFDFPTDINHCGGCNQRCPVPSNGSAVCVNSTCDTVCNSGFANDPNTGEPCVCEIQDEVCNNLDDDCDGEVDETFDLATDLNHCGSCNQACPQIDNAQAPMCTDSECISLCLEGYSNPANPTLPRCSCLAEEECDDEDNDCDGAVDEGCVAQLCTLELSLEREVMGRGNQKAKLAFNTDFKSLHFEGTEESPTFIFEDKLKFSIKCEKNPESVKNFESNCTLSAQFQSEGSESEEFDAHTQIILQTDECLDFADHFTVELAFKEFEASETCQLPETELICTDCMSQATTDQPLNIPNGCYALYGRMIPSN